MPTILESVKKKVFINLVVLISGLNVSSSKVSDCQENLLRFLNLAEEDQGTVTEGILGALDGFLLVLTKEGDIIYTSDNISTFLGLQQVVNFVCFFCLLFLSIGAP